MDNTSIRTFVVEPTADHKPEEPVEMLLWSDTERSHRYEISSFTASSDSPCIINFERRRTSPEEITGMGTIRLNGYAPNFSLPMYGTQVTSGWDVWVKITYKNDQKIGPVDITIHGRI